MSLRWMFCLCSVLLASSLLAQQNQEPIPPQIPFTGYHSPLQQHRLVGGFWRIDHSFVSLLDLKNIVETAPIEVQPTLVLEDGAAYPLPPVTLAPAGIATIDINQALSDLRAAGTPSSDSGTIEIGYAWHWDGAILAEVESIDPDRSLSYTSGLRPAVANPQAYDQAIQGLWWRHDGNTGAFLRFTNEATVPITAAVRVFGDDVESASVQTQVVQPRQTAVLQLKDAIDAVPGGPQQGGVEVDYQGPANGLAADGGMEDDGVGFSARLTFGKADGASPMTTAPTPEAVIMASVGVMIGKPDPGLMFPSQVRFHPYLALRNAMSTPRTVSISANYMQGSAPVTAQLLNVTLPAYASRTIDVEGAIEKLGLNPLVGYVNLVYSFTGQPTDVLISAGSVDGGGNYVFEVPAMPSIRSAWRDVCRWQVADDTDTMLTVWNHGATAQDLTLTLFFAGGSYKLPLHLEANASRMLNIGDVIASQQPDADGNTIPPGTTEGSAKISGSKSEVEPIEITAGASVFNVNKATCVWKCIDCNITAWDDFWADPDPWGLAVKSSGQLKATGQSKSGTQYDLTKNVTWASTHTNIATVVSGGSSSGHVSAIAPGDPKITIEYFVQNSPSACGNPVFCPGDIIEYVTAPGNVVSATVTLRDQGEVTSTDGAGTLYSGVVGTSSLGLLSGHLGPNTGCVIGNELVGTVLPSTTTESVTVKRYVVSAGCYVGSTPVACPVTPPADDTGDLITTNPQEVTSGGSANGHVFNLDTPGIMYSSNDSTIRRFRANFQAYAVDSAGTPISSTISYFVRVSCDNPSGTAQVSQDASPLDNQIGSGTTPTSWNLQ